MGADRRLGTRALVVGVALLGALLGAAGPSTAGVEEVPGFLVQGKPPPSFTLQDTSGRVVRLDDFRGRVILLSFWSCYTDTCFAASEAFNALLDRLGPLGLSAPTVCQEIPEALRADGYAGLLKRCHVGQTILVDPEQRVGRLYRIGEFPTSVLIGPDFTVREILPGVVALRDPAFQRRLEEFVRSVPPKGSPAP